MNDLISRQQAINAIENTDCELSADVWDELTDAIMNVPSAQPEIVRCKDCKYYRPHIDQDDLCVYTMTSVVADDFCSRAERRIK